MAKKCIKCGFELNDSDMFCVECGTPQPKAAVYCSNCGAEIPEGGKFCTSCGTPVSAVSCASQTTVVQSKYPDCIVSQPDHDTISITIKGVTFNMKLVMGGMVDKYTELSDFYIGETVVTQELWMMLMGDNPSEDNRDLQLPVTGMNSAMCNVFFRQLNKLTGAKFEFPTYTQWQYAHDGGKDGRRTKYAGSDNVDEVAWTAENSGNKIQPVALLNPNELGLFDMDGNVQEYCMGNQKEPEPKQKTKTICPICGNEIDGNEKSCPMCGATLSQTRKDEDETKADAKYLFNPIFNQNVSPIGLSVCQEKESNPQFAGLRLVINVPVSESIVSGMYKDESTLCRLTDLPPSESPLYDILLHQQQLQEPRLLVLFEDIKAHQAAIEEEKLQKKIEAERQAKEAELEAKRQAEEKKQAKIREENERIAREEAERKAKEDLQKQMAIDLKAFQSGEKDKRLLASCYNGDTFTGFKSQYKTSLKEYSIPSGFKEIGRSAFKDFRYLEKVTIPNGVIKISGSAFYGCSRLKEIVLPESVTIIEYCAFKDCSSLISINIPEGVTVIPWHCFDTCRELKNIELPNTVIVRH